MTAEAGRRLAPQTPRLEDEKGGGFAVANGENTAGWRRTGIHVAVETHLRASHSDGSRTAASVPAMEDEEGGEAQDLGPAGSLPSTHSLSSMSQRSTTVLPAPCCQWAAKWSRLDEIPVTHRRRVSSSHQHARALANTHARTLASNVATPAITRMSSHTHTHRKSASDGKAAN